MGNTSAIVTRPSSPTMENDRKQLLNNFKKQQIRASWSAAKKRSKIPVGQAVFLRVFKRHRDMQTFFGFPAEMTIAQLKVDKRFLNHTQTVQNRIQELVDNLDCLEKIQPSLFMLGYRHIQYMVSIKESKFVLSKHWDSLAEAIVFCVTEGQKFPGLYGAWRVLVCWMINQMRDGLMYRGWALQCLTVAQAPIRVE